MKTQTLAIQKYISDRWETLQGHDNYTPDQRGEAIAYIEYSHRRYPNGRYRLVSVCVEVEQEWGPA